MNKEQVRKTFRECFSVGLFAMGVYNILLLFAYFRNGRNRDILPSDMRMIITDIIIVMLVTIVLTLLELRNRKKKKDGFPDSNAEDE